MTNICRLFTVVVAILILSGCSYRIGDFSAVSTKNIYCKNTDVTKLPKREGVEGEDVRFLGIGANIQDAMDRALEAGKGNLMIDCALYYEERFMASGYRVRGTVVTVPYATTAPASAPAKETAK